MLNVGIFFNFTLESVNLAGTCHLTVTGLFFN
jgi:hypothetical protein